MPPAAAQGFTGFGFGLVGMAFAVALAGPRDADVLWTLLALVLGMAAGLRGWRRCGTHTMRRIICLFLLLPGIQLLVF